MYLVTMCEYETTHKVGMVSRRRHERAKEEEEEEATTKRKTSDDDDVHVATSYPGYTISNR